MKNLTILLSIGLVLFCSCNSSTPNLNEAEKQWLVDHPNAKIGLYNYFAPYQFESYDGEINGVFVDYLELIEHKLNYKFQRVRYEQGEWSKLLSDAKHSNVDMILEIQKLKDREDYLNFHKPLFDSRQVIFTKEKNAQNVTYKNLGTQHLIMPEAYSITDLIRSKFPNAQITLKKTETACLEALSKGNYDAYIGTKAGTNYIIKTKKIGGLAIAGSTPIYYKPTIAVVKTQPTLNSIIKKTIRSISLEEREVIFNNWLLKKSWPYYHEPGFWYNVLGVLLLLIANVIFFNSRLKSSLAEKTKKLNHALVEANRSNKLQTTFIQNISHEIRTPVNGILGYSELIQKNNIDPGERSEYVDIIIESGNKLANTLDNILEISILQTSNPEIRWSEINLIEIFSSIHDLYLSRARKKDLLFTVTNLQKNENFIVSTDENKLLKILKNIVGNAVKFTPKGFVKISYEVQNNTLLLIKVEDSGSGINAKEKQSITESYTRLEKNLNTTRQDGLGLGLSIAKKNATVLGGDISFISEEGKGTTFTIEIPVNVVRKETNPLTSGVVKGKKIHQILVAEDVEINFKLVHSILSRMEPFELIVHRAENGKEAVEICQQNDHLDLVIMDIRMPVMDGYEATKLIKELRPDLTVVAHTAYSSELDIKNAIDAGCEKVISKPINLKEFKATVSSYLV